MKDYSANKILTLIAIVMGGAMSIVFFWAGLPKKETATEVSGLLVETVGVWFVISVSTFAVFWTFYKLIVGVGRYVHDRFYRTPTL